LWTVWTMEMETMRQIRDMSKMLIPALVFVAVAAVLWPSWPARAAPDDEREKELYDEATEALDDGEYEEALASFDEIVRGNGARADGALYWKAYALHKLSRRGDSLAAIEKLREKFPKSRWLPEARALEVEIKQASGRRVEPEKEDDEELKLLALNGLMQVDSEEAIPMLERFLQGSHSRRLKEQALFVLVQTGSPRARDITMSIARGRSYPQLQHKAIEYLGVFGGHEASRLLKELYAESQDLGVKRQILQSYLVSGDTDALVAASGSEPSAELRLQAIQLLGANGARDELAELYRKETSRGVREQILQSLGVAGASGRLLEIARTEDDPRLRAAAVRATGIAGGPELGRGLVSLYNAEKDRELRQAVLDALFVSGDDESIIAIARKETDPTFRRMAVEKLSVMGSPAATKFLLEILEK